jgi:hypothetical protein
MEDSKSFPVGLPVGQNEWPVPIGSRIQPSESVADKKGIIFQGTRRCSDRLCGLVVRVPGYRSRGLGSIPGATGFSEKCWVWNGVHSAS